MAIYMKMNNIKGDVTTKGYEGTTELQEIDLGFSRQVSTKVGNVNNRSTGTAKITQLSANKFTDSSSAALLTHLLADNVIPEVKIFICTVEKEKATPHVAYTLSNVIVSDIHDHVSPAQGLPSERIQLHFTKIEKCFYPVNSANRSSSPHVIGFNLEQATLL